MLVQWVPLLLGVAALVGQAASVAPGDDLAALCRHQETDLTRMSQLVRLKAQLNSKAALGCTKKVRLAISHLVDLFTSDQHENVCSADKLTQFRTFYLNYVETADPRRELLPRPLQRFVLAYGMQVANVCKKQMVDNLLVQEAVGAEHFRWMEERVGQRPLDSLTKDFDLLLPGDMTRGLFQEPPHSHKLKIHLQTSPGHHLSKIKAKCRGTFKPVYQQVIMPYAFLYNSGFDYRDEELKAKLNDQDFQREVKRWNRITFLCEVLNLLEIIDGPQGKAGESEQGEFIKFLTTEEAENLKKQLGLKRGRVEREPEAAVSYKPRLALAVSDLVVERGNKTLMAAIRSFKTHEIELVKIRKKLMIKGVRMILAAIKARKLNIQFSSKISRLSLEQDGGFVSRRLNESDQIVVAIKRLANSDEAPLLVAMIFKELLMSLGIVAIFAVFAITLVMFLLIPALALG